MFRIKLEYGLAFLVLFVAEVIIAIFIHDNFVRPYVGDILVVGLIYCFVYSIYEGNKTSIAIGATLFCFLLEFLQYVNILKLLKIGHLTIANLVLGNYFQWLDLGMYLIGFCAIVFSEYILKRFFKIANQ